MKQKSTSSRLNAYLAAGIGASAAIPSAADAAIVYFDVDPDITINSTTSTSILFGGINLGTGSYVLGSTSGPSFGLGITNADGGLFLYLGTSGSGIEWGLDGVYTPRLALDASISGSSPWSWSSSSGELVSGYIGGGGNWGTYSGTVTGYAPLRMDFGGGNYKYGWAEITYANIGSMYTENATATITSFAFESTANTPIQAGAIPEPSTVACLVLGGSAFAFSRRRRQQSNQAVA